MMNLKKFFSALALMLMSLTLLTSCLSDDDEVTVDDHCYISSFKLGTLKRTIHTKATDGSDSTYTVSLDASSFPMDIDQRNLVIENRDSLPYGTRVNAVLVTIGYTGVLAYKQAGAVEWNAFSSKDSIDFSSPVEFVVYAQSGHGERHYKVKLNVHKQDGDVFDWRMTGSSDVLDQFAERRMVTLGQRLVMVGRTETGAVLQAHRTADLQSEWEVKATTGAEKADVATLQAVQDGTLLMSTTEGALLRSTDYGVNWQPLTEAKAQRVLAGVNGQCLYVLDEGTLLSSTDGGQTWKEEVLDGSAANLPGCNLNMVYCRQENGQERLVLTGQPLDGAKTAAEVWSKAWSESGREQDAIWMHYPHTVDNTLLCPLFSPMFVLPYNKGLVAFGGKTTDGSREALGTMLYSPDFGLTWQKHEDLTLPEELAGNEGGLAAAVDDENFIWITAGKQTWRGRLNRLGFE